MVTPEKAASVTGTTLLGDYWPCIGGLSAVSAIGTQLHDPIYLGLTRWRLVVYEDAVTENGSGLTQDGTAEPISRDQNCQARMGTAKKTFPLLS